MVLCLENLNGGVIHFVVKGGAVYPLTYRVCVANKFGWFDGWYLKIPKSNCGKEPPDSA